MFLLLALFGLSQSASAQTLYLPEFGANPLLRERIFNAHPAAPISRDQVTNFRVLVFPHQGSFTTPQGADASDNSVTITSPEACSGYEAILDSNKEWTKGASTGEVGTTITVTAGPAKTTYYECTEDFTVKRPAPLKSFRYTGDFVAVVAPSGVQIIDLVNPDAYVKGVIPSEVSASWPSEALKTQAVAARTYAWWNVVQARLSTKAYDMNDTVAYQAFTGETNRVDASDLAADQTEGEVMTYDGAVIKAYFSADSGGYTEAGGEVFEDSPYLQANPESYDLSLYPASNWTKTLTAEEIRVIFVNAHVLGAGISLTSVKVAAGDVDTSGRARKITAIGSDARTYTMSSYDFRLASHLKSTLFSIAQNGSSYTFTGRGYGHGVGMAQIGALQYVQQLHWTYDQILKFYYTGITIEHD